MGEVCDAISAFIKNPDITIEELSEIVRGPDFPTQGIIYGRNGIKEAYRTGKRKSCRSCPLRTRYHQIRKGCHHCHGNCPIR